MNDASGVKVTTPLEFTVYVPWFATVRDVPVHELLAVAVVQSFTVEADSVVPVPAASLLNGVID